MIISLISSDIPNFCLKKLVIRPPRTFFHIWWDITLLGSCLNVFLLIFCHFMRWKLNMLTKTCKDWSYEWYEIIHILSAILKCTRTKFWESLKNYTGSPTNGNNHGFANLYYYYNHYIIILFIYSLFLTEGGYLPYDINQYINKKKLKEFPVVEPGQTLSGMCIRYYLPLVEITRSITVYESNNCFSYAHDV